MKIFSLQSYQNHSLNINKKFTDSPINFSSNKVLDAKGKLLSYDRDFYKPLLDEANDEESLNEVYDFFSYEKLDSTIKEGLKEKGDIKPLYEGFYEDFTKNALEKLKTSGKDASNIEMLLELIEAKKLPPQILREIDNEDLHISKAVNDDLDKLYFMYSKGLNEQEVFVPKFKDKQSALEKIKIGEVCQIENNKNISIKTNENIIKDLFISPKAYLKLFAPVERFIYTQSYNLGDCYFIAALDSINQNPTTRHKLLEAFKENEDGTIDAALGGFKNNKGELNNPYDFILKDIEAQIKNADIEAISLTSPALMALEILNEKEYTENAKEGIIEQYNKFLELKNCIKNNEPIQDEDFLKLYQAQIKDDFDKLHLKSLLGEDLVYYNSYFYSKDELDIFLDYFNTHSSDDMFLLELTDKNKIFSSKEINARLKNLEDKDDFISNYKRVILQRLKRKLDYTQEKQAYVYKECWPKEIYCDFFNEEKALYSQSGLSNKVYEKMGLSEPQSNGSTLLISEKQLKSKNNNYVFSANRILGEFGHAYSLEPSKNIDKDEVITVRNPHNTLFEEDINLSIFYKNFAALCSAKDN